MADKPEVEESQDDKFMDDFLEMINGGKEGLFVHFEGKMRRLTDLPPATALVAIGEAVTNRRQLLRSA